MALLLLAGLTSACAARPMVLTRQPEPSAIVEQVRARTFERQKTQLELAISIDNPGAALQVTGAEFELLADDQPFGAGELALEEWVPALGRAPLRISIELAHLDLPRALRQRVKTSGGATLVVRGRLRAKSGTTPLTLDFDGSTRAAPSVPFDED
jgi:hypothetical protein